jgi:RHS repeat-associated protein
MFAATLNRRTARRRSACGALITILVGICRVSLGAQSVPGTQFNATGLQPERGYFAQLPFESIDMVNGNLLLTFTDLVLPGNAGMDLRIVRTYNHQAAGTRWEFGFAGVPLRLEQPVAPDPELPWEPALVTADGSRHRLYSIGDGVFVSPQFWRYTSSTRTLELPNGWVATYEDGNPAGGVMLVEVHDVYGNSITPDWEGGAPEDIRPLRLEAVTQTVGDAGTPARSRTVTFSYPTEFFSRMPQTMTFAGGTWTYLQEYTLAGSEQRLVTRFEPPVGRAWQFAYDFTGLDGTLTVTLPHGATMTYDFDDRVLPEYEAGHRSVVASAALGEHDVPAASWSFTYTQLNGATGTATGPNSRVLLFEHVAGGPPSVSAGTYWLLTRKTLTDGGREVARVDRTYTHIPFTPQLGWDAPWVSTLTQTDYRADGTPVPRVFTTTHEYRTEDPENPRESDRYGDYHRPWKTTEDGELRRITTQVYDYDFSIYLRNRTKSETVKVGSETGEAFTSAWEYQNETGFLETQTIHGITTTFARNTVGSAPGNTFGNPSRVTDGRGRETRLRYEWGVVKDTTRPAGDVIARTINSDGTVSAEVRSGLTTSYLYTAGRLDRIDHPFGDDTIMTYDDAQGRFVEESRGTGTNASKTTTTLDGLGRPRVVTDPVGGKTETRYNAFGQTAYRRHPHSGTNPPDVGDTIAYDALGRVRVVTHADNSTVTYTYEGVERRITDEEQHTTVERWDAFGSPGDARLAAVTVTDTAAKTWTYSYHPLGALAGVAQPDGPGRTWTYVPGTAQLQQETHPESGTTSYAYWPDGTLKTKTDARGQTFAYDYDANGRLTSVDAPGTTHDVTVLAYDALDNRRHVRRGTLDAPDRVETWFVYRSDANLLQSRTDWINGRQFTTSYTYDARGNLDTVTYPSGRVIEYDRNLADQITTVKDPAAGGPVWAHSFAYHPTGAIERYTLKNGTVTSIGYDTARLWPEPLSSGPLALTNHEYDRAGNLQTIADARGAAYSQGFTYDALDRLKTVTGLSAESFEYDARGNRTKKNGVVHAYQAGTDRLLSDGVTTFGYDGAGNVTSAGAASYTYTPYNLLATATVGGTTTTFRYDADNDRRMKTGANGTEYFVPGPGLLPLAEYAEVNGQLVHRRDYLYADGRLLASIESPSAVTFGEAIVAGQTVVKADHLRELRTQVNAARALYGLSAAAWQVDPTITAQTTIVKTEHIQELRAALDAIQDRVYEDDTLVKNQTPIRARHFNELREQINALRVGGERYYHLDAQGSVRAVTDATGSTLRRHDYGAFGHEIAPVPASDPRRFTGKERDGETGLDYFSARYHHAVSGRFTSADPGHVGGNAADPQSWNAYAHARNNPFKFSDPTGTDYELDLDGYGTFRVSNAEFMRIQSGSPGFRFIGGYIEQFRDGKWVIIGQYRDSFSVLLGDAARTAAPLVDAAITVAAGQVVIAFAPAALAVGTPSTIVLGGMGGSMAGAISRISNPRVRDALSALYQETDRLRGGTAAAVQFTRETARLVGRSNHLIKAGDRMRQLENILRTEKNLSEHDRRLAEYALNRLKELNLK